MRLENPQEYLALTIVLQSILCVRVIIISFHELLQWYIEF